MYIYEVVFLHLDNLLCIFTGLTIK
uniref:Uncharacterized protein n=1 Tax=Anguilla anguilla TaxID=7936 RepID=A0A0E9PDA8_ANGAN